jgi:hypothetical protein
LDDVLEHLKVERNVERSRSCSTREKQKKGCSDWKSKLRESEEKTREEGRTHERDLAEQDILSDSTTVVGVSNGGGLHEDLDRLLERTPRERSGVRSVDAVSSDGHESPSLGHQVA